MINLNVLTEARLRVCDVCEHKTEDWKCSLTKQNLPIKARSKDERCPIDKWGKTLFSKDDNLQKLLKDNNLLTENGEVCTEKLENLPTQPFPAHLIKQSLNLRPTKYLISKQSSIEDILYCANNYPPGGWPADFHKLDNVQEAFRKLTGANALRISQLKYPAERFSGRGIVICGGGPKYYPSTYVNIRILRLLGCTLPVHVYYLGLQEMDIKMKYLLESIGNVKCINGRDLEAKYPIRIHGGWEAKVYAIINCDFQEVLMLDADNTPLINPEHLFDEYEYKKTGAIFWPDYACWHHDENMWKILGINYRDELQVESGQILVNKAQCWKELNMAKYYCDYSDYYFKLFYGDKETFHFGWRFFESEYGFPPGPDWINNSIIIQKNFDNSWLFSHRAQAKFRLDKKHPISSDVPYENDTLELLDELNAAWDGNIWRNKNPNFVERKVIESLTNKKFNYIRVGIDSRELHFIEDNKIGEGAARLELEWHVFQDSNGDLVMSIIGENNLTTAVLRWNDEQKLWRGKWLEYERCDVELEEII